MSSEDRPPGLAADRAVPQRRDWLWLYLLLACCVAVAAAVILVVVGAL